MIQAPKSALWLLAFSTTGATLTLGCSGGDSASSSSATDTQTEERVGSVGLRLALAGGASLNSASYTVTGPGGFAKTGSIDLTNATTLSATIGGLPAGTGYSIALSATTTDGSASCGGSAAFDVQAGKTTSVSVAVQCHEATKTGSVAVQGVINVCPVVDALSALPNAAFLGGSVALSAQAHDSDSGPAALVYRWRTSSGTLAGLTNDARTFTCTAPGTATITVTASDSDASCDTAQTVNVDCGTDASTAFYTTKTPYRPQQSAATYEVPPSGFTTAFTEIIARHGSRGLSSVKYDAAALNMWKKAADDGALTALGATLGDDITRIMKANALLDFGVAGITTPGYGNLTQVGIGEQQQLAARLLARQTDYFAELAATAGTAKPRVIQVVSSGVDRAVDSAAFFAQALTKNNAQLAALLNYPAAPGPYPLSAPILQPAGTNRFLLYFHKLAAKTDQIVDPTDPLFQTYQDSLAFQAYATNPDLTGKLAAIAADPSATTAARAVLEGLFSKSFVDKIDNKTYSFANTGTYAFTSDDGLYSAIVTGDGKTTVKSLTDAASMLYNLYVVAPAMKAEAGVDFTRYVPQAQARTLAYLQDAQDFYQMGPGIQEANPVTYKMAQALEDDFFKEIDAIAHGDTSHGAKLRFTHAEIIVPFASILGLKGVFAPVPQANTYTYETNPWRGELVSPMAANVQWDVYSNPSGALLVKMLYNEKEVDFKADCDSARYAEGSHFYAYDRLAACYGHSF